MEELLNRLKAHNIQIRVVDNNLKINLPEDFDAKEILIQIKSNKSGLIDFISKRYDLARNEIGIKPVGSKKYYKTSSAQKRLFFLNEFDNSSTAYNISYVIKLVGELDRGRLSEAFERLVLRNESLRTSFVTQQGEIVQQVAEQVAFAISYLESSEDQVQALMRDFVTPFDLSQAPLLRVGLVRLHSDEHVMMVDMHHIISDGVSLGLLIKDFMLLYKGEALPPLKLQYKDYAEWQQGAEHGEQLEKQKSFWVKTFAGELEPLALQTDYKRPLTKQYAGDSLAFALSEQQTSTLKAMVDQAGATLFMGLLSVLGVMLSKLSNQEDIVIGTPVDGRRHADVKEIIGMFVNTLPLRVYPRGELRFSDFLEQVKSTSLSGFDNQAYPFEDLVDALGLQRDTSRNPLFDVMLNFQNFEKRALSIPGLAVTAYESEHRLSKFDLTLYGAESEGQVFLTFQYSTCLFKRETIERYVSYFNNTLDCVCAHPEILIKDVSLWDEDTRQKKQEAYKMKIGSEVLPIQLKLSQSFKAYADRCAIEYIGKKYTFSDLVTNAGKVSSMISAQGIASGSAIGIMCEDRQWVIGSMLGIMQSRKVFVPLDTTIPAARLASMISQAGCRYIITDKSQEDWEELVTEEQIIWLPIEEIERHGALQDLAEEYDLEDQVYIYFTSGTTGTPKAIVGKNKGLSHFIEWEISTFGIDSSYRFSQFTNPGFDAFLRDILVPLCSGGTICIPGKNRLTRGEEIRKWIENEQIDFIHCVPSYFKTFTEEIENGSFKSLKYILLAGEKILPNELARWYDIFGDRIKLVNLYGPTETTMVKGVYQIRPVDVSRDYIPIQAIEGAQFMLLDKYGRVCPELVVGEIYIRTPFRTAGYIKAEDSSKSFVQNPFTEDTEDKIYRTGDLGRINYHGELEVIGRADSQVKIYGARVELDDIRESILKYPGIKQVEVAVRANEKLPQLLCAYYVSESLVDAASLGRFLSSLLPRYMLPSHFVRLAAMPLTPSGKIDRKALPEPELGAAAEYVAPASELEEQLAALWSQVLALPKEAISATRSFFELGGHSLKAIGLVNKLGKALHVELPLKKVFEYQSIRELGRYLEGLERQTYCPINPAPEQPYYRVSSAQKRMYFLYAFDPSSTAYNMSHVLRLEGVLDRQRLTHAFYQLICRHESLRTSFELAAGVPVQKIAGESDFQVSYAAATQEQLPAAIEAFIRPFDLSQAPLLRVGLLRVSAQEHVLLVDMHHIISDGVSLGLLIKDFMALYRGEALPPLSLQYKDYAEWQQSPAHQERLAGHGAYWLEAFAQPVSLLELPTDFLRPAVPAYGGRVVDFKLGAGQTSRLKALLHAQGSTLFMGLLAIYNILLSKLSNQEDIVVGSSSAGRSHPDLEPLMGMFVNTLALRNYPQGQLSFKQFLQQVTTSTLSCFDHQSYQYEDLIDALALERNTSRNPLFDVAFDLNNQEEVTFELPGLRLRPYERELKAAQFDLSLRAYERQEELWLSFEYATALFKGETIARFIGYFHNIVAAVIEHADAPLSSIEMLPGPERQQLLIDFNDSQVSYGPENFIDLLGRAARQYPTQIALCDSSHQLTYEQLERVTNRIANYLRGQSLPEGQIIPLLVERGLPLICLMVGIQKAGYVFVALDVHQPADRLQSMLLDCGGALVITDQAHQPLSSLISTGQRVVVLEAGGPLALFGACAGTPTHTRLGPDQITYLIYTSGSTGLPKGVLLHQQGMVNHFRGLVDLLGLDASDCIAQTADCSFDIFVVQALLGLVVGARTVIVSREDMLDADRFSALISQQGVTVIELVPTVVKHLLDTGFELAHHRLRWLISCGEKLTGGLVSRWYKSYPQTRIVNAYGPAEASDDVSACVVPPHLVEADHGFLPIGKPLPNVKLYIMNHYQQLCPLGTRGEICISGVAVGKGYWRNPEQTRSKFVSNPYVKQAGEGHTILYRTGDVGYWQADGNLVFVGRKDSMVKIRGARVELGEIEASLLSLGQVEQVVVLEKEGRLVAYYVANPPAEPAELREQLSRKLPDYMVPSHLVPLPSMPLTANGKIDRKALPEPHQESVAYCPPRTKAEHLLSRVFSQVLGRERVGIDDNFFAIGGDSIKSIQICSRLRGEGYRLTIQDIFTSQVIRQLALRLREEHVVAPQGPVVGQGQLTPIQQLHFQGPIRAKHHYNQALTLCFAGGISRETVGRIFDKILLHHDALRMVFREQEGVMMQHNQAPGQGVWLEEKDLRQAPAPQQELLGLANDLQASLDLAGGPLLKLGLYHLAEGSRLLVVIHHLVVDGVSWRILLEDVQTLYGQVVNQETLVLPLKTDAFVDWSGHLEKYKQGVAYQRGRSYWQSALDNQALNKQGNTITRDYQTGSGKLAHVKQACFSLSRQETAQLLTRVHRPFNTQINDVLLAAFWLAVSKHYGLQRLRIDMEGHGREDLGAGVDVSRTVGWFTSIYPVWLTSPRADTGADLSLTIRTIKEQLRQIPNKGFDYLLYHFNAAATHPPADTSPPAAAQVFFEYLGQFDEDVAGKSFRVSSDAFGQIVSPDEPTEYDWYVSAMVLEGQLQLSLSYCDRFKASSLVALLDLYRQRLQAIIAYCAACPTSTLSPSDLRYRDLSIPELDHLQQQYAIEDIYPLSPMQEGMLFHALADQESPQYFEQVSYHLEGDLDLALVEGSVNELIARHAVLRTLFLVGPYARPLQLVLKKASLDFRYKDVRQEIGPRSRQEVIAHYEQADRADKFDLGKGRLMRLTVLQVERQGYVFIWSHHHVLMDGWCMGIIINEYSYLYASLRQGKAVQLPPVRPYADYINWLATRDGQASAAYWRSYLAGYQSQASLPRSAAKAAKGYCRQVAQLLIGAQQTSQLRKLGVEQAVTLNTVLECAWGLLLSRYNDREDVVFGSVVSGRPSEMEGVEDMVGLFINTVPVRMQIQPADTLSSLLTRVQGQALASEPHHYSPLYQVQSLSELGRGLLDHVLVFENYPVGERIAGAGQQASDEPLSSVSQVNVFQQTSYDLSLEVYSTEVIRFNFVYNENAFEAATINSLMGHLEQLLTGFGSAQGEACLGEIDMLSLPEQQQLLVGFNQTAAGYAKAETIPGLFEKQVAKNPGRPAVVFGNQVLSYGELNEKSNQLARLIRSEGTSQQAVIGILMHRSPQLLVSIMGVLKAGCAYVPIDPEYPIDRIRYIAGNSRMRLMLTEPSLAVLSNELGTQVQVIEVTTHRLGLQGKENLPTDFSSSNLAYVIYTSGSTGNPKGVMVEHRNVLNFIHGVTSRIAFSDEDTILCLTTVSFDIFVLETILPLLNGMKIVLSSSAEQKDIDALSWLIRHHQVDVVQITPSHLRLLLSKVDSGDVLRGVKTLLVGGEAFPASLLAQVRSHYAGAIYNMYGPTETTVWSTIRELTLAESIDIGTPISNTIIRILDRNQKLQPVGVAGELCIGGEGVARGYWENEKLTAEKFILDPITHEGVLYKTGDLARWLPDGRVEYLGRTDNQIKLRGFRIELGEIEQRLAAHERVKESVVLVKESAADKHLVAYYVSNEPIAEGELRALLAQQLPDYMLPAHFVHLQSMPLTPNGKLDRKALPDPEFGAENDYVAPEGELEGQLVGLWSEVLGLPEHAISVTKNFFELGGHSLKAVELLYKIEKSFSVKVPLEHFFQLPTVKDLSQSISILKVKMNDNSTSRRIVV